MSRAVLITLITTSTLSLGACGKDANDAASANNATSEGATAVTAATLGEQTILSSKVYLAQETYAAADVDRGETLSMQCRACHTLEKGGADVLGPNLYALFGRTAGSAPDYSYSEELANSSFVWTPRALDAWLAQPYPFLPGNRMSYPGLPSSDDRNAVIAYLLHATDAGDQE
jgi:cytochrome c